MLDELDKNILYLLRTDGRISFLEISRKLGCSEGTVRKRVKKMQAESIIKKFSVELDQTLAFETVVCIKIEPKSTRKVVEKIKKINQDIFPIFEVTGKFDIICICRSNNARAMNVILDEIRGILGVLETESFTIIEKD